MKVRLTMGTSYCCCPSETVEIDYDGTEEEFDKDDSMSTEILNMIFGGEFPHYFQILKLTRKKRKMKIRASYCVFLDVEVKDDANMDEVFEAVRQGYEDKGYDINDFDDGEYWRED